MHFMCYNIYRKKERGTKNDKYPNNLQTHK